jgi:hypothetical protein
MPQTLIKTGRRIEKHLEPFDGRTLNKAAIAEFPAMKNKIIHRPLPLLRRELALIRSAIGALDRLTTLRRAKRKPIRTESLHSSRVNSDERSNES